MHIAWPARRRNCSGYRPRTGRGHFPKACLVLRDANLQKTEHTKSDNKKITNNILSTFHYLAYVKKKQHTVIRFLSHCPEDVNQRVSKLKSGSPINMSCTGWHDMVVIARSIVPRPVAFNIHQLLHSIHYSLAVTRDLPRGFFSR